MKSQITLTHKFVEVIPDMLQEGVIYVSIEFAMAIHKCCCGCGNKVVTPFSPDDWELVFNGETVSFYPSIGNWSYNCRSHYWIRNNKVIWAETWEDYQKDKAIENKKTLRKRKISYKKKNLYALLFGKKRT
jgi:hypothetical protein